MAIVSRLRLARLALTLFGLILMTAPGNGAERLTSRPRPALPKVKPIAVGDEVRTAPGERPMRPEFGCQIRQHIDEELWMFSRHG